MMTLESSSTPEVGVNPGRIVVGIDGSAASIDALDWAGRQAQIVNLPLELIMAWDWPSSYGWVATLPGDYDPSQGLPELLSRAASDLRAKYPEVEVATRVMQGHPAQLLVHVAKGADLLVIGSRGHGEFVGMLIGSVGEYCATHAHCPVLVHQTVV
jgi:nucleotide-binding universal stress UspA family protein